MKTSERSEDHHLDRAVHRVSLKLRSELSAVEALVEIGHAFALPAHFSDEDATAIGLALREAAANASRHGNRLDLSKTVTVELQITSTKLIIAIADQGEGFSESAVADPLHETNLFKPSGRGLLLMRNIMDEVCVYNSAAVSTSCGTRICFIKPKTLGV